MDEHKSFLQPAGAYISFSGELQTKLKTRLPNKFAGMEIIGGTQQVYMTADDPLLAEILRDAAASTPPETHQPVKVIVGRKYSYAALTQFRDEITRRAPEIRARGIVLVGWGPDVPLNKVHIWVNKLTPEGKAFLEHEFGSDRVAVEESGLAYALPGDS